MPNPSAAAQEPNPAIIFDAVNAYQRSFALKAAIDLDIFSAIAGGSDTVEAIASATSAPARGIRILCDYMVIHQFLTKEGSRYANSVESALFLNKNSQAYFGSVVNFMLNPGLTAPFLNLTEVVKTGRTTLPEEGTVSVDNPIWVDFARHMAPMMYPAAEDIAEIVGNGEMRVLDIAAGHGLFGILIAKRNPDARVTAVDWPNVVAVAVENAAKFGVSGRHSTLPGDAFEVDYGGPYDVALVTNFFHHYNAETCEKLMRKIHASLTPGGRCVTLEFVPNDDRVTPPGPAAFSMMMLGSTAEGDAYTFAEYDTMLRNAGFGKSELRELSKGFQSVIVSYK